jgi:hypothetical protein
VTTADRTRSSLSLEPARRLDPQLVLSTHLPPAHQAMPQLLDMLASAPDADPFVGPDQEALEQLLAQMGRRRREPEDTARQPAAGERAVGSGTADGICRCRSNALIGYVRARADKPTGPSASV